MKITNEHPAGTDIELDGNELAHAIDVYLAAHDVVVTGPRTVRVLVGGMSVIAREVAISVYVDPSGRVNVNPRCGRTVNGTQDD